MLSGTWKSFLQGIFTGVLIAALVSLVVLGDLTGELQRARGDLAEVEREQQKARERLNVLQRKHRAATVALSGANERIDVLEERLREGEVELGKLSGALKRAWGALSEYDEIASQLGTVIRQIREQNQGLEGE